MLCCKYFNQRKGVVDFKKIFISEYVIKLQTNFHENPYISYVIFHKSFHDFNRGIYSIKTSSYDEQEIPLQPLSPSRLKADGVDVFS